MSRRGKLRGMKPGKRLKSANKLSDIQRFLKYVKEELCPNKKGDVCWLWIGTMDKSGYGQFRFQGQIRGSHRVSYAMFVGTIPEDFEIDHKVCNNPSCVNPNHLVKSPASKHHSKNGKKRHEKEETPQSREEPPF